MDLDGDGRTDILSGSWPGELYFFRRQANGSFTPGTLILDREGKPIKRDYPGYGTVVHAVDWDSDGDLDLIVGNVQGSVLVYRNDGTRTKPLYGAPETLAAGGETIKIPGGDAGPAVADWDGDSKPDLLVGTGNGSVVWYRNIGAAQRPVLAAAQTLVAETVDPSKPDSPRAGSERGVRAKICVADWNGDGRLDLLLGDFGPAFVKTLNVQEKEFLEERRRQQEDLRKNWAVVFREYRQTQQTPPSQTGAQDQSKIRDLRQTMGKLKSAIDKAAHEEQATQSGRQYHGRVWMFLRKPKSVAPRG